MKIHRKTVERNLLLECEGELDHAGAKDAMKQLDLALDGSFPLRLVLDFTGITFMDSSGIALILRAQRKMQLFGGSMMLCNVPPQAMRVLDAAGISRIVTIRQEAKG